MSPTEMRDVLDAEMSPALVKYRKGIALIRSKVRGEEPLSEGERSVVFLAGDGGSHVQHRALLAGSPRGVAPVRLHHLTLHTRARHDDRESQGRYLD